MAEKKDTKRRGRPSGPYGPYKDPALLRKKIPARLPSWMLKRLSRRRNLGRYLERLILEDTGWREPKTSKNDTK